MLLRPFFTFHISENLCPPPLFRRRAMPLSSFLLYYTTQTESLVTKWCNFIIRNYIKFSVEIRTMVMSVYTWKIPNFSLYIGKREWKYQDLMCTETLSHFGLAFVLMLRPVSPELVMFRTLSFEHPSGTSILLWVARELPSYLVNRKVCILTFHTIMHIHIIHVGYGCVICYYYHKNILYWIFTACCLAVLHWVICFLIRFGEDSNRNVRVVHLFMILL